MIRAEIFEHIKNIRTVNSHSHHMKDEDQHTLTLTKLFQSSYVNWCGLPIPTGEDKEEVTKWLNVVRNRNYFVYLEKALMDIYKIPKSLTAETWNLYDNEIKVAHKNKNWHLEILKEIAKNDKILLDALWRPGDNAGHNDIFSPSYRINSIFYGFNNKAKDHNGNNFQTLEGFSTNNIDEYTAKIEKIFKEKKDKGCSVLKCALAYDRTLSFGIATKEQAQKAMCDNPRKEDIEAFQDYIFNFICKTAVKVNMPVQIHTGLGLMNKTNAMQLQPLIERNPNTTFWLMHGSYPWIQDILGLCHAYPNVWADLCWLPLISTQAAKNLLSELIDVCNSDRIIWGCDTWTSEESYGARLALLDILSDVLAERIEKGKMNKNEAIRFANAVLHDNVAKILGF